MKRVLNGDDVEAAVYGGAILGGGGGGFVKEGLETARLALTVGNPELWTIDEFGDDEITATVALVGAPAAPGRNITPAHSARALQKMIDHTGGRLVAIHTNENGSETTVNGWFQSALTGLPLLDFACNGRAHPSSLMGAMGLHLVEGYRSVQAYAGGAGPTYLEGVSEGALSGATSMVRQASIDAGGWVGVTRNPITIGYAKGHGAVGVISSAINLGRAYLDAGLDGVVTALAGRIIAQGPVVEYECNQRGGLDIGKVVIGDGTVLHFVNEYMVAEQKGTQVSRFPELIMTFDDQGAPKPSGRVRPGDVLSVLVAPVTSMTLSPTMFMPELYVPLEEALGIRFAPQADGAAA